MTTLVKPEIDAIYLVVKQWADDDGWPKAPHQHTSAFTTEEAARTFMFDQTSAKSALDYGYADVRRGYSMDRWTIEKIEVQN